MWDFYCMQYSQKESKQKGEEYAMPHNIEFYKSFPDFPKHNLFNVIVTGLCSMAISFIKIGRAHV